MLLNRPGQLVTREELKRQLWPSDTFVDFDHSLNKAVNRLRENLGDSAEQPRFIETLPRRGYRLIAPVETPRIEESPKSKPAPRIRARYSPHLVVTAVGIAGLAMLLSKAPRGRFGSPVNFKKVTADGRAKQGPLLVDGSRIYFTEILPGPTTALAMALVKGSDTSLVSVPLGQPRWAAVSPDRSEFLVLSTPFESPYSMWIVPVGGGPPRRVGRAEVDDASWSPDGESVVYAIGSKIHRVRKDSSGEQMIAVAPGLVGNFRWSP